MAEEKNLQLDDEFSFEIKPTKSTVAAVAAGILVVLAGFLAYNIFSKPAAPQTLTPEQAAQTTQPATGENQTTPAAGDNGSSQTTTGQTTQPATQNQAGNSASAGTTASTNAAWTPLAHATGSISGSEYTVQSGDTLWEIAQGRYGSGYKWYLIAQANGVVNNSLGYPLIYPGQVLKLPDE